MCSAKCEVCRSEGERGRERESPTCELRLVIRPLLRVLVVTGSWESVGAFVGPWERGKWVMRGRLRE